MNLSENILLLLRKDRLTLHQAMNQDCTIFSVMVMVTGTELILKVRTFFIKNGRPSRGHPSAPFF
jgi:hypothetical protein